MKWALDSCGGIEGVVDATFEFLTTFAKESGSILDGAIVFARTYNGVEFKRPQGILVPGIKLTTKANRELWTKNLREVAKTMNAAAIVLFFEGSVTLVNPRTGSPTRKEDHLVVSLEHEDANFGTRCWIAPIARTQDGLQFGRYRTLGQAARDRFGEPCDESTASITGRSTRLLPCNSIEFN